MKLAQLFYKVIYQRQLNYILRNCNLFFSSFLPKKIKIPPSGVIHLKTNSGKTRIATNQTSYVTQILFWKGYKVFEYSEIFEQLSKDVDTFLDIGANIGYYSLLAAKANPNIKIYAFEPATGPSHFLKRNIKLNNFEHNITAMDFALSEKIGTIDFYEVNSKKYSYLKYNLSGEHNTGTKKESRNFVKNSVASTTLSEFIKDKKLTSIDLIKLDTEGTEVSILKSGMEFIATFQPIVISEMLFNTSEESLESFFKSLKYQFFVHTPRGLIEVASLKRKDDNGIRNCFFVPKFKRSLIDKFVIKEQS